MSEDTRAPVDFGISSDSPWPRDDHSLSGRGADWRTAAYFHSGPDTGEYLRIEGFKQAAELVYEQMVASSSHRSTLVYPFVWNWRHVVELQLKELVGLFQKAGKITVGDDFLRTHNLAVLWEKVRPVVAGSIDDYTGLRKVEVTATTRIIGQLTAIDPDGQELRYHVRTDGKPSLAKQSHIDPSKFRAALQGVSALFVGLSEVTYQELELQRELAEEYGP
ncbi:hypothetical protein [Nocardia fluminea]|uniref:Uncharacterized protein n=1 Tax=Nocardia fluminea TaxID=134984 RepID=A0A2N3V5B9_9NOCA|nr:hypothetical protein [Nocardia fluminea]PKV76814.1 hypothetical protein ATK86_7218 [Nocardia fluminea]